MLLSHVIDGSCRMSSAVTAALDAFIDQVQDSPAGTVPVVELAGTPGRAAAAEPTIGAVNSWERVVRRLERVHRPTICVLRGACGGLALEVLLATDFRIAAPGARLHLAGGAGDIWPGMGLYRLVNQVGLAHVRRAALLGEPLTAQRALAIDLVDEVTDEVDAAVVTAIARLGRADGADVSVRRQLMLEATGTRYEEALGRHLAACDRLLRRARAEEARHADALV